MKYVIAFTIIIVVGLAGWWGYSTYLKPKPSPSSALTQTSALSPAVEALLTQKLALLTDLVANASLVKAVETAGSTNAKLTQSQIQELDAKWQKSAATDPFITQFLTNSMAQTLFTFQEQNPGFAELFVTDKVGLNVGQTNKTSDYYQADEDWWTGAYNAGRGRSYHREIEYDESAKSESIALYVPIFSTDKQVIGVIKAVLDITAINKEL